jgi:2-polyprenyl-6-methoxyphenol hydroxylase-like FAD-dependent oxidoreductase
MAELENVLIVGGGISGTSLAVGLSALGLEVTLVESEPEWGPLGVGITLQGPALRAFGELGLLDAVVSAGVGINALHVGDASGEVLETIPLTRMCGEAYPGTVTIRRPALHTVLAAAAAQNAVQIRTACTVSALEHRDHGVIVTFADGSTGDFDLAIGADGVRSQMRQLVLGPGCTAPDFTQQAVWRVMLPRHANVGERMMVFYGPTNKIGFSPMPPDEMYVFVVQGVPTRARPPREELPTLLSDQLSPYSGWLADIPRLIDPARIDYRPIDVILVPNPWYVGRVLLIGDAAHATTPHLASGATIAIEDAAVLTEMIAERPTDVEELLARFMQRRFERCRMVVENGVQLGRWEREPVDRTADAVELMRTSFETLAQPA